jgi:DNA-directed RNA polymerase specialized sigma24 family protein
VTSKCSPTGELKCALCWRKAGESSVEAISGDGRDLAAALQRLSEMQRAALVLCFEHGLTHEEAAAALGCPGGTLKSHISRGKLRLREWLDV